MTIIYTYTIAKTIIMDNFVAYTPYRRSCIHRDWLPRLHVVEPLHGTRADHEQTAGCGYEARIKTVLLPPHEDWLRSSLLTYWRRSELDLKLHSNDLTVLPFWRSGNSHLTACVKPLKWLEFLSIRSHMWVHASHKHHHLRYVYVSSGVSFIKLNELYRQPVSSP